MNALEANLKTVFITVVFVNHIQSKRTNELPILARPRGSF